MFEWSDVRVFLALAECKSALAASRRLNMTQTTVSRRIERLEAATGLKLFEKTTRGYSLTPNGTALRGLAEEMSAAARKMEAKCTHLVRGLSGTIRLSSNAITMQHYGLPIMTRFREANPDVTFEVDTQDRQVSLEAGEADVALRAADKIVGDTLIARMIDRHPWCFFCSEAYADEHGVPEDFEALKGHRLVRYEETMTHVHTHLRWLREAVPVEAPGFQVNSVPAMIAALKAGAGVGVLPRGTGEAENLRRGPTHPELRHPIWIVASQDAYATPLVRSFLEFFKATFPEVAIRYDQ